MKSLEYIELDGRSFIGTKLPPDDQNLALEFWVKPGQSPWGDGGQFGNGQYAVFAGSENGKGDRWAIQTAVLMEEFVGENCGTYTNSIQYFSPEWYHIVVENGELSVYQVDENDGSETLVGQEQFDPSSTSLPNVYIGTINKEDTDFYDAPCCGVLFGKIIVNGDELLPAEDDEGTQTAEPGTIGWFDETNGVFYENGGDGSFIAGPYVASIELNPTTEWISAYRYGMTTDIEVICNNSWSVINSAGLSYNVSGNVISFIVPSNTNTGAGVTYNIEVQDNTTGDIATATITQGSASPISISPIAVTIAASGGAVDAQVVCRNDPWTIVGRWPDDEVISTNIVRRHIPANTTQSAITYYIVVQNENTLASATTEITQEAAAPQPVGTNTMFVGAIPVDMLYVGDTSASKAYIGDQLVWEAGPLETSAALGDVVVYSTNDSALKYIPYSDYNTNDYPTNTFKPVGVVCENQVDNSVCMICLNRIGISGTYGNWGAWDTAEAVLDVAQVPYYTGDINVAKTMNVGREVTAVLVSGNTEPADFENNMGSVNFNEFPNSGQHTAAIVAYMHETSGTSRGDWFVPSPYDLRDVDATGWNTINTTLGSVSGGRALTQFWTCIMTATGYNPHVYYINNGSFSEYYPWYKYGGNYRAVYRGRITHI